jgi:hypothetical protein
LVREGLYLPYNTGKKMSISPLIIWFRKEYTVSPVNSAKVRRMSSLKHRPSEEYISLKTLMQRGKP